MLDDLQWQEDKHNLVVAADVEAGQRSFLRHPDLPLGEVVIIAGAGGIGKGQFGAYVLACLSAGIDYRTGRAIHEPCNNLFVSTEDTSSDIRARLDRADVDADLHRIFIVDKLASFEMGLTVSDDMGLLMIERINDQQILAALIASGSIRAAAKNAGVAESTIRNRLNDPGFRDAIRGF